ncbi:ankyrin repeat domain-containing protein [Pirellulales bacterium]|nr:ankyrin repeat domain-containing protein [Pirellulales bacterium]
MSASLDGRDLIAASRAGDLTSIERAIASNVPIDFIDAERADADGNSIPGRTALMWATVEGQVEAVATLLKAGASPGIKEKKAFDKGATVWELAARYNRGEILKLFHEGAPRSVGLAEALYAAAEHGSVDAVTQLLDLGIDVNTRYCDDQTALMAAAGNGKASTVDLLLRRGASLKLRSKGKFAGTALHDAVVALQTGVRVSRVVNGVWVYEDKGEPVECVRLLLEHGCDPNDVRSDGDFPIVMAAGESDVVRMLIDAGADVNVKHRDKMTALHWAVLRQNLDSVRFLLKAKADPSPVDETGQTPLDIARQREMVEIAKTLEEVGGISGMETVEGRAAVDAQFAEELAERRRTEEAIAADEALLPDFAERLNREDYQRAVTQLEKLTDATHETPDDLPALASCSTGPEQGDSLFFEHRDEFLKLGCTLFQCGKDWFGKGVEKLGILPTTDPFEVLAAMRVAGPNYGVHTSEIVQDLRELYEVAPFHLKKVRYDLIELEFQKPIPKSKARKWAVRLNELCPDLMDESFTNFRQLREHLSTNRSLTLWWD